MSKVIFFINSLSPRDVLTKEISAYFDTIDDRLRELRCKVTLMQTQSPDPFTSVEMNGIQFSHSIDFELQKMLPSTPMIEIISNVTKQFNNDIDLSTSTVVVGYERHYRPASDQAFRYHYLMCKKPDFTQADYLDYYTHHHAGFGLITRGIEGYSQFYCDLDEMQKLNSKLNTQTNQFSSVSQMTFQHSELDFDAGNFAIVGPVATDDEEQFVDRQQSVMMSSKVIKRFGSL